MGEIYNWLSMAANFAVLVGIVFVIIQIKQSNASIQGAAYQTWVATNTELNTAFANENLNEKMYESSDSIKVFINIPVLIIWLFQRTKVILH